MKLPHIHSGIGKPKKIKTWYDRRNRCYVTSVYDKNDYQVEDSLFSGTKADRDLHIKDLEQKHRIKYMKEDETPTNCIGDASGIAGLDNNPPKKKLRAIIKRKT